MCETPSLAGTTDHSADHRLGLASGSPGERSPARIGPGQAMRLPMIDRCALNEHSVSPLKPEELVNLVRKLVQISDQVVRAKRSDG